MEETPAALRREAIYEDRLAWECEQEARQYSHADPRRRKLVEEAAEHRHRAAILRDRASWLEIMEGR